MIAPAAPHPNQIAEQLTGDLNVNVRELIGDSTGSGDVTRRSPFWRRPQLALVIGGALATLNRVSSPKRKLIFLWRQ